MKPRTRTKGNSLRKRAEKILCQKPEAVRKIPVKDIQKLIHELDVYQIELDMQNDELRNAQAELEQSRAKYVDLYDFAPVGYFTLTETGKIEEVNLAGTRILGIERTRLANRYLRRFIAPEFTGAFESHRSEVLASESVQKCELKLIRKDGTPLYASLESLSVKSRDGDASTIRSAMSDITERYKAQMALRESEERCRYLATQLLAGEEAEHRRMAEELHDTIGHALINMKHQIEPSLTRIRKEGSEEEVKGIETFFSVLNGTMEVARRLQQDLRPSMLDDLGLLATIGWLCRIFGEAHRGIRIDQSIKIEEKEIPVSLKLVIFRILQEALNNVGKHTQASLARFTLKKTGKEIELVISDNGPGFDVKETPHHGLGLVSMRERAELSRGSFAIESVRGKGTTLRAAWPLRERT